MEFKLSSFYESLKIKVSDLGFTRWKSVLFLGLQFGCLTNSLFKEPWCFFEMPMVWLQRFQRGCHRHQNTNAEQCFLLFVAIAADQILQPHINAVTPRYAATPIFGWWVVATASCLHFGPTFGCGGPLQTLMDFQSLSSALAAIGTPTAWQTFIADDWDVSEEFLRSFAMFCQSHSFLRHLRLNLSCINKWT